MRKAYAFTDRMLGIDDPETQDKKAVWNRAIDEAALSKLRFRIGDRLTVVSGERAGTSGSVGKLLLRHVHAYLVRPENGEESFPASEDAGRTLRGMIECGLISLFWSVFNERQQLGKNRSYEASFSCLPARSLECFRDEPYDKANNVRSRSPKHKGAGR